MLYQQMCTHDGDFIVRKHHHKRIEEGTAIEADKTNGREMLTQFI